VIHNADIAAIWAFHFSLVDNARTAWSVEDIGTAFVREGQRKLKL
jgi:hypothetical protein